MEVTAELPLNQVILGDCTEVMQGWPEDSIDCIVTDPPYGLKFMGKNWDKTLPPRDAFYEMHRVLKPGALAFVMSSPRQDMLWRMLAMLEGVGFQLRQSHISWITKTGFPKAYDVSKGIDRRQGGLIDRDSLGAFIMEHRESAGLSRQDASELVTGNRTGAFWNWENNYCVPLPELWPKIKEVIQAPDSDWDEQLASAEREKIKLRTDGVGKVSGSGIYALNKPESNIQSEYFETAPALDLAKKWEGWKSQSGLKPALEMILMVYKPRSEKTIVDNVLRWGTGAINVDACRIPYEDYGSIAENPLKRLTSGAKIRRGSDTNSTSYSLKKESGEMNINQRGRFPSNLLVSDKAIDTGEITQSRGHTPRRGDTGGLYEGGFGVIDREEQHFEDVGGASRYFDLDAWAEQKGIDAFLVLNPDIPKPLKTEILDKLDKIGVKGQNVKKL